MDKPLAGAGYFSCRTPGHGGILPAAKLTPEIVAIRGVVPGQDVVSPQAHTAFSTPLGRLLFLQTLREGSGGKPVGFKLCVGKRHEFLGIVKAMIESGIVPDFITVDGAAGADRCNAARFHREIYPSLEPGSLLNGSVNGSMGRAWETARPDHF